MIRRRAVVLLALSFVSPSFGQGQTWDSLSPGRRELILRNYQRYQAMSPEKRGQIQERYKRYRRLSPARKAKLLWRWMTFQSMTPERQAALRRRWERMSPAERRLRLQQAGFSWGQGGIQATGKSRRGRSEKRREVSPRGEPPFRQDRREPSRSPEHGGRPRRR